MASEATTEEKLAEENTCETNIGEKERWISLAAGGILTLFGLSRRSTGGVALALGGAALLYRGLRKHCPMYEALGIDTSGQDCNASQQEFSPSTPVKHGFVVQKTVTINKPREEVYGYWRNFENLPRFMDHLLEVRVLDEKRSTWVAKAPGFGTVEWDAIITDERPNEMVAWHSARDAQVHNTGSVRFHDATGGRGTEVKVVLQYHPPAGALGAAVARLFGENPEQQIEADLRRFKNLLETGEVPVATAHGGA
jgi:uncharacterized membrane protein